MIKITDIDSSYVRLSGSDTDLYSIWDRYSFYVPGYRFMPSYKNGTFDGQIHLLDLRNGKLPYGLVNKILDYCDYSGIDVSNELTPQFSFLPNNDDLDAFFKEKRYFSNKKEIFPRDDQKRAVYRALQLGRCVNVCPTSFGKSLCIWMQCQWNMSINNKILIIVPTVDLVVQFMNDIIDYNGDNNDNILPNIYCIRGGVDKNIPDNTDIVISTWQSLYKMDEEYYKQFDTIILDEAHKATAKALTGIFNNANKISNRTGWTGSLKKASINELQVEGIFGPVEEITDVATLMADKVIADLSIKVIRLKYSEEVSSKICGVPYQDEIKFIESYNKRNSTVIKLTTAIKKTGLILFNKIAHGTSFYNLARKMYPEKNVYFIYGNNVRFNDVKYKSYGELKEQIEKEEDALLICSYGVFSTGISIKNLHYIVFGSPVKSFVRTVQSIGRVLRVSDSKKTAILIDIVDDLSYNKILKNGKRSKTIKENYAIKHFKERFKTYIECNVDYKTMNIKLYNEGIEI